MTQDEALILFEREATKLKKEHARQNDVISALAQVISQSQLVLSEENVNALVTIGAILCRNRSRQTRARADIAEIMKKSHDGDGKVIP